MQLMQNGGMHLLRVFITGPSVGSIAASSRGQQVIADGLVGAIEQYFAPPAS